MYVNERTHIRITNHDRNRHQSGKQIAKCQTALVAKICLESRTRGHFILGQPAVWLNGFIENHHSRPILGCRGGQVMPVVTRSRLRSLRGWNPFFSGPVRHATRPRPRGRPGRALSNHRLIQRFLSVVSQKFFTEAGDGNAGPSTPLKYASLRMTAAFRVLRRRHLSNELRRQDARASRAGG
jgi:hypothetical protein